MAVAMAVAILPSAWWDNDARFGPCYDAIRILICRMLKLVDARECHRYCGRLKHQRHHQQKYSIIWITQLNVLKWLTSMDNGFWAFSPLILTQKLLIPSHTRQFTLETKHTHSHHRIQCWVDTVNSCHILCYRNGYTSIITVPELRSLISCIFSLLLWWVLHVFSSTLRLIIVSVTAAAAVAVVVQMAKFH